MELISFDDFSKKYYNIKLSIYLTSINEIDISKQNVVYEMTHLAKNKDTKTAIVCLDENNFLNKNNNYRNKLKIDLEKNNTRGEEVEISTRDSKIKVWIVPTNEELVIARDTKQIVENL